jgi:hypothetical protein
MAKFFSKMEKVLESFVYLLVRCKYKTNRKKKLQNFGI